MRLSDYLADVGKPIAYYPKLAHFLGSVNAAVFLCQLIFWEGKQHDEDGGWIYKKQAEIEAETGLTRREQETARKALREPRRVGEGDAARDVRLVEEDLRGVPPTMHFRVDYDALDDLWDEWRKPPNQNGGNRQIENGGNRQIENGGNRHFDLARSAKSIRRDPPNQNGAIRQNIGSEITTESTSETTREHTHTDAPAPRPEPTLFDEGVCVSSDLTFDDYREYARAHSSFTAPDAWAREHFPKRDPLDEQLVREWKESRARARLEAAPAPERPRGMSFAVAASAVSSHMASDPRADARAFIDSLGVDEDVRARLVDTFAARERAAGPEP